MDVNIVLYYCLCLCEKGLATLISFFFISVLVKPPYEVTETGWGEFEVVIKIYFNDPNERPVKYFFWICYVPYAIIID